MKISEADFLTAVKAIAYQYGWLVNHNQPSLTNRGKYITTGAPGFFDLVLTHHDRGYICAELKSEKGQMTSEQKLWRHHSEPHIEYYLWRPQDLPSIQARLGRTIDRRSG